MTSMQALMDAEVDFTAVKAELRRRFEEVFGLRLVDTNIEARELSPAA
jgi:hypothetical protein